MSNKQPEFPDYPNLSASPTPVDASIPISVPRGNVQQNSTQITPQIDLFRLQDFIIKTKDALEARTNYYNGAIERTEKICNAYEENIKLIHALLWYSLIVTIFLLLALSIISFLFSFILNENITRENVKEFISGSTFLLSIGSISSIIAILFIKNFYTKFSEINTEIRDIKEQLSRNNIR